MVAERTVPYRGKIDRLMGLTQRAPEQVVASREEGNSCMSRWDRELLSTEPGMRLDGVP